MIKKHHSCRCENQMLVEVEPICDLCNGMIGTSEELELEDLDALADLMLELEGGNLAA